MVLFSLRYSFSYLFYLFPLIRVKFLLYNVNPFIIECYHNYLTNVIRKITFEEAHFQMDLNIVSMIYLQNYDSSFYFQEEYIFLVKHRDWAYDPFVPFVPSDWLEYINM